MLAVLPLLSLIILFLLVYQKGSCWRSSALLAALTWGLLVTIMTEVLSIFKLLSFSPVLILWTLTNITLILAYFKLSRSSKYPIPAIETPKISFFLTLLLGSVIAIVVTIGLIALIAPPNNWDSMTYHMGRVVHWIQNHSVAHYPTAIPRQLSLGPWAGFAIAHLQILSGSDRFANLVQWFSMVGSILGVSLIAKQLGADLRGQVFSAVACATIPMGILQASSTQTDYVGALWLVCFVHYVLLTIQDKMNGTHVPKIGVSLGLAILSKGTAYFYAFPFFIWFALSGFKRLGWKLWKPVLIIGSIVLAINFGHYLRNFDLFNSVFGASEDYKNGVFSVQILISNTLRNLALHISTPVRSINLLFIKVIQLLHVIIGVDVNDPRTTYPPGQKFDLHSLITHEDLAGNPIHLLLFILTAVYLFGTWRSLKTRQQYFLATYLLAITVGFLLFCFLLTWSPWRSRLHLPLFVLSSAFVGVILSKLYRPKVANSLAIVLILTSSIWLFCNESRPLILNSQVVETGKIENIFNTSRVDQYFVNVPDLRDTYIDAAQFVESQNCSNVGLYIGGDTWEYPFWLLFQKNADEIVRLEHVSVDNASSAKSKIYPYKNFTPCAIIASKPNDIKSKNIIVENNIYVREWSKEPVSVFLSKSSVLEKK